MTSILCDYNIPAERRKSSWVAKYDKSPFCFMRTSEEKVVRKVIARYKLLTSCDDYVIIIKRPRERLGAQVFMGRLST